jgi:hypothetical protein
MITGRQVRAARALLNWKQDMLAEKALVAQHEHRQETDYTVLQRLLVDLVQSRAGQPIALGQVWLNDAQTLARKIFEHLASLRLLTSAQCVEIDESRSFEFIDHGSAKVVARAALETYLVFFFIYGGSDRPRSEFRHKIWRYGGLADRQKSYAATAEARSIKATEKTEMDRLKKEIESSPHLRAYPRDAAKRILKGEWRGSDSWAALGKYAGFHENYFQDIYGYLCGYSHASYISAMQVGGAQSLDDQQKLATMCIGIGVVLMAHFARTYTELFDETKSILHADYAAKTAVERWGFCEEEWANLIARRSAS